VLFIYYTNRGYAKGSGCYNLDCKGFVQTNHQVTLGNTWTSYSSYGNEVGATFSFLLHDGNWWFSLGGNWLGYYPTSVYREVDDTAMAAGATSVDFGGEVTRFNSDDWPQMGSGEYADDGWSYAASHLQIRYFTPDGRYYYDADLTTDQEDPSCFTIDENEQDENGGTWFTFGGPGGPASGCDSVVVV